MNVVQIHLAINHFPVVLAVVGAAACAWGWIRRSPAMQRYGLSSLCGAALAAVPTFLSGDAAGKLQPRDPGLPQQLIEEHEEAAEAGLALVSVAGACAWMSLILLARGHPKRKLAFGATLVLAVTAAGFVARAAHLGGLIRHPELRAASADPDPASADSIAAAAFRGTR